MERKEAAGQKLNTSVGKTTKLPSDFDPASVLCFSSVMLKAVIYGG